MTPEDINRYRENVRRMYAEPENRRRRAFHECGHATWLFLDGREDDIQWVDIELTEFGPGAEDFDTGRCSFGGDPYSSTWVSEGEDHSEQLARANRCIAFGFAGPICEWMSANPVDERTAKEIWEDHLRYDWEQLFDWDTPTTFVDNPSLGTLDFGHALAAVYAIDPPEEERVDAIETRHQDYLEQSVRWLVELFSDPVVWQVVEALAAEFEPIGHDALTGYRAREIASGVWGTRSNVVLEGHRFHYLGREWVQRYRSLQEP